MDSRAPLFLQRRHLLVALAALPMAAQAASEPLSGLKRYGSGEYRRFGFLVYEATLWAADNPLQPPLALQLTYKRPIKGEAISEASVNEIRALGLASESQLKRWGELMRKIFPDVQPQDSILGLYQADGASFYWGQRLLATVPEPEFARAFFSIWLDSKTSAPQLRAALLQKNPAP